MNDKKIYLIRHEHRFGVSSYLCYSKDMRKHSDKDIAKFIDFDFEPELGETIEYEEYTFDSGDIPDIDIIGD